MLKRALLVCLVPALFALSGNAQVISGNGVTVQVPFPFTAGTIKLPAGDYLFETPTPGLLRVSTADRKDRVMLLISAAQRGPSQTDGKLIFSRYGDQYFLSSVWAPGHAGGIRVRPSSRERELIAQGARVQTTTLLLHRR